MNAKELRHESRPDVSTKVREFYERMPYPAPLTSLDEHRELYQNQDRGRVHFHLMWPTEALREDREILVAGCGTSQAARYALREPKARVTAIDISETSLLHTRTLQQKYHLENLEVHRLSIERAKDLGRAFDQIVCTGVLHHLPDPDVGLRALREVLKPQGAIHLMVYAAYGRAGIYMIKEYCGLLGVEPSDSDLQELGAVLAVLPSEHPLTGLMRKATDFNHPDAMADALLHPIDRAYTVPEVYEWLKRCGFTFGRWLEQAPYLPQCGVIATTAHGKRLRDLPLPQQHAALELFRGTMVRHTFIAYRNDRSGVSQPISFTGDRWRNYVPIRVPWTVSVRERIPHGCAAVLINRAHPFTDLILKVDKHEDHLLGAIDGKRTLGEILMNHDNGVDEGRALNFFERLWQYDQVVFDASRSQ